MRSFLLLIISLVAFALSAAAQKDFRGAEVFGGYQFTHFEPSVDANGWNAGITGNVNRWFGVTADFSGAYKNDHHIYTFMFGPSFTSRVERLSVFGHVLAGGATSGEFIGFSMAMGGGIDVSAGRHLAVRLIQADWLVFAVTDNRNARVSAGVVWRF